MTESPLLIKKNDSHSSSRVNRYARQCVYKTTLYSRLPYEQDIPTFRRDELILGDLLGSGAFSHVYELKALHGTDCTPRQDRARLSSHPQAFAVKFLKKESLSDPDAAADFLLEAKYLTALASLEHPNIIRLHGISAAVDFAKEGGFFLILDRLQETFHNRVAQWKVAEMKAKEEDADPSRWQGLFVERLQAGVQLSCALTHLHQLRIIFRDLKADNIGFDGNQNLVLFDFGLAKELNPRERTLQGLYRMSGNTGARRFMAPEVALRLPYSLSADVYSFSMILWELCALEPVFDKMSSREHWEFVIQGNQRPTLCNGWSASLKDLFRFSWARDPRERPQMSSIHKMLQQEVEESTNVHTEEIRTVK